MRAKRSGLLQPKSGRAAALQNAGVSPGNWCRLDALQLVRDGIPYEFLKGGDISELPRLEHYGAQFYDNGLAKDCLQILKDQAATSSASACITTRATPIITRRNCSTRWAGRIRPARAMGFKIQLTFHYTDYWSNPSEQSQSHDWEGLSFPQLTNVLYGFTRDFMVRLTNANIFPDYVSLGNEIRGGIPFPDVANTNWNQLATLLQTGYSAVKSVSPSSQVVIHLDKVDAGNVNWFFGILFRRHVNFDVIGCSYYPFCTRLTSSQARAEINSWYPNFNKPVIIMETGYNWNPTTCNGRPGQLSNNGPEPYLSTPQGQRHFLLQCFNDLKLVTDGHCVGALYWDPVFICVPGQGWQNGAPNVVGNTTLFNFTGNALPSLDAFGFNN
jgi:arabinogalactan endo-1,4-beta-galactosidase